MVAIFYAAIQPLIRFFSTRRFNAGGKNGF